MVIYLYLSAFDFTKKYSSFVTTACLWFYRYEAMGIKRQKQVRKSLAFYKKNFGYSPPYYVLVDGTFCRAALKQKINIREQLPKYLEAEVNICTTQCILDECEAFGKTLYMYNYGVRIGPLQKPDSMHVQNDLSPISQLAFTQTHLCTKSHCANTTLRNTLSGRAVTKHVAC